MSGQDYRSKLLKRGRVSYLCLGVLLLIDGSMSRVLSSIGIPLVDQNENFRWRFLLGEHEKLYRVYVSSWRLMIDGMEYAPGTRKIVFEKQVRDF